MRSDRRPDELLTEHCLIRADRRESVADALLTSYGARSVDFSPAEHAFAAVASRARLDLVTLHFCRYDTPTQIQFGEMAGVRLLLPMAGAGQIRLGGAARDVNASRGALTPEGADFFVSYGARYAQLVVQMDAAALQAKARVIVDGEGRSAPGRLLGVEGDHAARLRAIAVALARQLSNPRPGGALVRAELEQALLLAFLSEDLIDGAAGRGRAASGAAYARRLEEYLQAHWDEPLAVDAMAEALGVSARTLFAQFKAEFGVTPMAYLRDLRLDHARRRLETEGGGSVLDVALRCGFASFGHFARRYSERFGELPSETLARRPRS